VNCVISIGKGWMRPRDSGNIHRVQDEVAAQRRIEPSWLNGWSMEHLHGSNEAQNDSEQLPEVPSIFCLETMAILLRPLLSLMPHGGGECLYCWQYNIWRWLSMQIWRWCARRTWAICLNRSKWHGTEVHILSTITLSGHVVKHSTSTQSLDLSS
jgi:hypothetical protein